MRTASYLLLAPQSADAVSRARTRTIRLLLPLRPILRASSQLLPCSRFELSRILQNQFEKRDLADFSRIIHDATSGLSSSVDWTRGRARGARRATLRMDHD